MELREHNIAVLSIHEIDQIGGGVDVDYSPEEVAALGAAAVRVGMTVAAVNPAAGAAIAAVGATAILFGGLASSLD